MQLPLIQIAKEMGLKTLVADRNSLAPGMKIADRSAIIDTRDAEKNARFAEKFSRDNGLRGVITVGTDMSYTVAYVAQRLGLPGIRPESAQAATNKSLMRQRLSQRCVSSPLFQLVSSREELQDAAGKLGYPLVIKPLQNMGARGVQKIESHDDLDRAFRYASAFVRPEEDHHLIVEEFIPGPELSIDAVCFDGRVHFMGIADRIIKHDPYFVEIGHNMPSQLETSQIDDACQTMIQAMDAIGIDYGAAKGDIKISPQGAVVGEIAARLSGGFMSGYTFPYSSGIQSIKAALQLAIGEKPTELEPKKNFVCIERAILAEPGFIEEIHGKETALNVEGVKNIFWHRHPGDESLLPKNNLDKIGNIIVLGDNLAQAEERFFESRSRISIQIRKKEDIDKKFIEKRARNRFGKTCHVCKVCDGKNCASGVPGMGGSGDMFSFQENSRRLDDFRLLPSYIHEQVAVDLSVGIFERKLASPLMIAPVTGTSTNMGGRLSEAEFVEEFIHASAKNNIACLLGEGTGPERYKLGWDLVAELKAPAIPVFKPHRDLALLEERIRYVEERGALAWAMDIDAVGLRTMEQKGVPLSSKTLDELKQLKQSSKLPLILKGVLSPRDMELARVLKADIIYLSNHGGRILDGLPAPIDILHSLSLEQQSILPKIWIDGGFRKARHIFTGLAFGAQAVLLGRPFAIYNMGAGRHGLQYLIDEIHHDLVKIMTSMGRSQVHQISRTDVRNFKSL